MTVPEEFGGLGMDANWILCCSPRSAVTWPCRNRWCTPALVAVPLLRQIGGELAARLPRIAGEARVVVDCSRTCWWKDAPWPICCLLQRGAGSP